MAQLPLDNIEDVLAVIRSERNLMTLQGLRELRRQQDESFIKGDMTLMLGSRVFRNFKDRDLLRIDKAYQRFTIVDVGAKGAVSEAAVYAYRMFKLMAERHRVTGAYANSVNLEVRSVGGRNRMTSVRAVERGSVPSRPVFTMIPYGIAYANKLETLRHHGALQGFLFHISNRLRKKYGKAISVKFDYVYQDPGTLPRLQIGNPGDVRGRSKTPRGF